MPGMKMVGFPMTMGNGKWAGALVQRKWPPSTDGELETFTPNANWSIQGMWIDRIGKLMAEWTRPETQISPEIGYMAFLHWHSEGNRMALHAQNPADWFCILCGFCELFHPEPQRTQVFFTFHGSGKFGSADPFFMKASSFWCCSFSSSPFLLKLNPHFNLQASVNQDQFWDSVTLRHVRSDLLLHRLMAGDSSIRNRHEKSLIVIYDQLNIAGNNQQRPQSAESPSGHLFDSWLSYTSSITMGAENILMHKSHWRFRIWMKPIPTKECLLR